MSHQTLFNFPMNISYYTNRYIPYTPDDISLIEELYNKNQNICEIGKILKRTPGQISFKLKQLGIIKNHMHANGYSEYVKSQLYSEIVTEGKKLDEEKKAAKRAKAAKITLEILHLQILKLQEDIREIKEALRNPH
jgi:hypothetical protein